MWWYECYPPHLSNVATLPCEFQSTVSVKLQRDLPKKKASNLSRYFPGSRAYMFTYFTINLMLLTLSVASLIVHLMQTSSDFEQDIIDAVIDWRRDRLRSYVHASGTLLQHALKWIFIFVVHQNIFILSMQFDAFNGCVSTFTRQCGNIRWSGWYSYFTYVLYFKI